MMPTFSETIDIAFPEINLEHNRLYTAITQSSSIPCCVVRFSEGPMAGKIALMPDRIIVQIITPCCTPGGFITLYSGLESVSGLRVITANAYSFRNLGIDYEIPPGDDYVRTLFDHRSGGYANPEEGLQEEDFAPYGNVEIIRATSFWINTSWTEVELEDSPDVSFHFCAVCNIQPILSY